MDRPWTHINRELREYPTYRGLVKDLPNLFKELNGTDTIHITRQLRGQWGQRFEYWKMIDGKPSIVKEGWY